MQLRITKERHCWRLIDSMEKEYRTLCIFFSFRDSCRIWELRLHNIESNILLHVVYYFLEQDLGTHNAEPGGHRSDLRS